jgi:alginate O-acetyltransferase complex protein AlgI
MVRQGLFLFSLGLAKKCLIANPLAQLADKVFALPKPSVIEAWSGALCYSFQIYFDFSGYSTMAIGLGLLLGFHLPQNFNQPYTATSVTDFWRRWHITLSRWFRDYLYIPLGGNRGAPWRTYLNLAVVFLLCGLWHGASVTFLLWGAYHGGLLIFERIFSGRTPKLSVAAPLRRAMTFVLILFGWVLFRAGSFHQTMLFWGALCGSSTSSTTDSFLVLLFEDFRLTGSVALASLALLRWDAAWTLIVDADRYAFTKLLVSIGLLALCLLELAAGTFNPFIYYRF